MHFNACDGNRTEEEERLSASEAYRLEFASRCGSHTTDNESKNPDEGQRGRPRHRTFPGQTAVRRDLTRGREADASTQSAGGVIREAVQRSGFPFFY